MLVKADIFKNVSEWDDEKGMGKHIYETCYKVKDHSVEDCLKLIRISEDLSNEIDFEVFDDGSGGTVNRLETNFIIENRDKTGKVIVDLSVYFYKVRTIAIDLKDWKEGGEDE